MKKIWDEVNLSQEDWFALARAFYAVAHCDFEAFRNLPEHLRKHPAGLLCAEYIETRDTDTLNSAGYMITHTSHWYVFLGRTF